MKRKGYHEAREKKKDQRATVVSLSERQVVERSLIYSITARLVSRAHNLGLLAEDFIGKFLK